MLRTHTLTIELTSFINLNTLSLSRQAVLSMDHLNLYTVRWLTNLLTHSHTVYNTRRKNRWAITQGKGGPLFCIPNTHTIGRIHFYTTTPVQILTTKLSSLVENHFHFLLWSSHFPTPSLTLEIRKILMNEDNSGCFLKKKRHVQTCIYVGHVVFPRIGDCGLGKLSPFLCLPRFPTVVVYHLLESRLPTNYTHREELSPG